MLFYFILLGIYYVCTQLKQYCSKVSIIRLKRCQWKCCNMQDCWYIRGKMRQDQPSTSKLICLEWSQLFLVQCKQVRSQYLSIPAWRDLFYPAWLSSNAHSQRESQRLSRHSPSADHHPFLRHHYSHYHSLVRAVVKEQTFGDFLMLFPPSVCLKIVLL